MLDIWEPAELDLLDKILAFQKQHCFEHIKADRVVAHKCKYSPYAEYLFLRLTHSSQRIFVTPPNHSEKHYNVGDGAISYLLAKVDNGVLLEVIPLHADAENIYAINKLLSLSISRDTVAPYLMFYGHVVAGDAGSFYFITNIEQLSTLREQLPERSNQKLDGLLRAFFVIDELGNLDLNIERKSYPLIGTAFTLRIPTIYDGEFFITDIRVSGVGVPEMDEDDPTTIRGLDEKLPPVERYPLEFSKEVSKKVEKTKQRLKSKLKVLERGIVIERLVNVWLLPAYIFSLAVVFYLGFNNTVVYEYYEEINNIMIFNWGAMLLGGFLLSVFVLRFAFIEIAVLVEKLVPNQLSKSLHAITRQIKAQQKTMGSLVWLITMTLEFVIGAVLTMNIFIYGLSNFADLPMITHSINFIEAFLLIVLSVPILGPSLGWVFEIGDMVGLYRVYRDGALMYLSSAVIVTITLGLLIRLFRIGRRSG